jgi:hypothetical protein
MFGRICLRNRSQSRDTGLPCVSKPVSEKVNLSIVRRGELNVL